MKSMIDSINCLLLINCIRTLKVKQQRTCPALWRVRLFDWFANWPRLWRCVVLIYLYHYQVLDFEHRSSRCQSEEIIISVYHENCHGMSSETPYTAVPLASDAHPTWSGSTGSDSSFKGCSTYGSSLSESSCQIPTFLLNSIRLSNIRYDYFEIEIDFGFVYIYIWE